MKEPVKKSRNNKNVIIKVHLSQFSLPKSNMHILNKLRRWQNFKKVEVLNKVNRINNK